MSKDIPAILVIGDIILDHYLKGTTNRISPEAPVPVVEFISENWQLGGASNVANNLISIRADVALCGIIGNDQSGKLVKKILEKKRIFDLTYVSKNRKTTTKTRIIASNHQLLRIDKEDTNLISEHEENELFKKINSKIGHFDCVIISDYNKGLLTNTVIKKIIDLANSKNIKVFVDPKTPPFNKFKGAFLIKPNKKEALLETGFNIVDYNSFIAASEEIQLTTSCNAVVITLSENGVGLYNKNIKKIFPTTAKKIFDVTGAGDTFIAMLAYSIAKGKSITESCELANFAAGLVISKDGCAPILYSEIKAML